MGPPGHYQLEDGLYDKPRSRKKTYLYSALVLLLLIAAGVGIGVVVSRLSNDDDSPESGTIDATVGGSAASGEGTARDSRTGGTLTEEDDNVDSDEDTGAGTSETTGTGQGSTDGRGFSSGTDGGTPPGTREFPDSTPSTTPAGTTTPATAPVPPVTPATGTPTAVPVVATPPVAAPPTAVDPLPNTTQVPVAAAPAPVAVAPAPVAVAPAPVAVPSIVSGGASNTWATLPDIPLPMGEVGAGVLTLNGNPYLVIAGEHPFQEKAKNGVTMILDLTGGEWYEAAKRPSIGNHHAAEVIGNKLYLFGGLSGGEKDLQIGTLVAGTAGVDISWKLGAPLAFASGSAATALIGGNVYYCGGIYNDETVATCAIYNPATNTWSTAMAPMPVGRNHAATCTDGKKMYIFGGRDGKNVVGEGFDETQIYDPATDTWTAGTPFPVARGGMGKAVYSAGKCYVFGGEVWENDAPSVARKITPARVSVATDIYTIGSDTWSSGADLPVGLHGSFPVEYDGVAILASGGIQAAYSQSQHALAYTL